MIFCKKKRFNMIFKSFFMNISVLQDSDTQMYTVLIINVVMTSPSY